MIVPSRYFEQVWRESNGGAQAKAPQANDLDAIRSQLTTRIKNIVAPLLPTVEGLSDPKELVAVNELPSITPPPIPEPEMKAQVMGWLAQYWSTLGLGGLALVSLLMLRSMVRSASVPPPRPETPVAEAKPDEEQSPPPETKEAVRERRLKRLAAGGPSLRDELSELVTEDPDAAANILRTWIGNVG